MNRFWSSTEISKYRSRYRCRASV